MEHAIRNLNATLNKIWQSSVTDCSSKMEGPVLLTLQISSINSAKEALNEQSQMALVSYCFQDIWAFKCRGPSCFPHLCVCVCGSSSFQQWWTSCHSSSPCKWRASRRCESSCEPAASAARRNSSRSLLRCTWTSGHSCDKMTNKPRRLSCTCFVG